MKNKENEWAGYNMQEVQTHRAINAIRLEVAKEKFFGQIEGFKEGATGNVASFLMRNLGTVSKGVAISSALLTIGRKIYTLFRK